MNFLATLLYEWYNGSMYNDPSLWKSELWYTNLEEIKYRKDKYRLVNWIYFKNKRTVFTILCIESIYRYLWVFRSDFHFYDCHMSKKISYSIFISDIITIIIPPCNVKWKVKYSKYPFHILTRLWAQKIGSLSVNSPIRFRLTTNIFQNFSFMATFEWRRLASKVHKIFYMKY